MIDLATFLLARIAEDESTARGAWPETWQVEGNNVVTAEEGLRAGYEGLRMGVAHLAMTVGKYQSEVRNAEHIVRWDPARVLAECEKNRRIVGNYLGAARVSEQTVDTSNILATTKTMVAEEITEAHLRDLRALALPYADHKDYRPEWAI